MEVIKASKAILFLLSKIEKQGFSLESGSVILLMILLAAVPLAAAASACAADAVTLTPTENHHIIELNSNQPYVAGYHVDTRDLYTRERVDATSIAVSFPSTDVSRFPPDSWLGAGMFVQGQDNALKHVDYGYYTMVVIDNSGSLFVDVGLHETRESSPPLQMPTSELVYAYTWQISGVDPTTSISLTAKWDSNGYLHYSVSTLGTNTALLSIDVASLPHCENATTKFYAGNVMAGGFPLGHYAYYFQFGVVSSKIMADTCWSARLEKPRMLRRAGWNLVETAWTIQGDISYLDYDWVWGGAPYPGVQAKYYQNPLLNPYEVVFSYSGETLPVGTVLWDTGKPSDVVMIPPTVFNQPLGIEAGIIISVEITTLCGICIGVVFRSTLRKKKLQSII